METEVRVEFASEQALLDSANALGIPLSGYADLQAIKNAVTYVLVTDGVSASVAPNVVMACLEGRDLGQIN